MAVGLTEPDSLLPVKGIRLSAIAAGIKNNANSDLVLIEIAEGSHSVAVFTQNKFCAAPVTLAKKHLSLASPRYLIINSGNANAGTGEQGLDDALQSCQRVAEQAGCKAHQVLPFSTGVIGEYLPLEKISRALPELSQKLDADQWVNAGRGIMTTDTLLKGVSKQFELQGKTITITGLSKGAGMIQPNMATMLGYVAMDAAVSKEVLQHCIKAAVHLSFNAITVDSDTSTNDACVLIATGCAGNDPVTEVGSDDYKQLLEVVTDVFMYLAQAIIRDAEGATKFISLRVDSANTENDARQVAYTVAHSPLVKTALFASDPNWGRILAAVGRAGVEFDLDKIKIYLDDVCIVSNGGRDAHYTEDQGQKVMQQSEISIRIELNTGQQSCCIWTSDLSYDYVKINSEYRS
ncbi:MAG TPA: bifunctional glutamate N-acetyltransferase/amino-acid acetyltransferase ArgJ [Gammaproteobacteria bacterium]|nr:bifunctional glutamate N-acetyltransferase/amino-acid acetyltransferase ArgJ [Gammaproteobacteria bacterium]